MTIIAVEKNFFRTVLWDRRFLKKLSTLTLSYSFTQDRWQQFCSQEEMKSKLIIKILRNFRPLFSILIIFSCRLCRMKIFFQSQFPTTIQPQWLDDSSQKYFLSQNHEPSHVFYKWFNFRTDKKNFSLLKRALEIYCDEQMAKNF